MYEYELRQIRSAELIREADQYRLARKARRAAREASEEHATEGWLHSRRPRRHRLARAA